MTGPPLPAAPPDLPGDRFDGHTSRPHPVTVRFEAPEILVITASDTVTRYPLEEISMAAPLGTMPWVFGLPDGARLEVPDGAAVSYALAAIGAHRWERRGRLLHRLEGRLKWALLALLVCAVTVWGGITLGLPLAARWAVPRIPPQIDALLGREGLAALDRGFLTPSTLDAAARERVERLFTRVTGDLHGAPMTLVFRHGGPLGANALALPSGTVVVTDELVALADDDHGLLGILAHEAGHVIHRHTLRQIIQNGGALLLIGLLTGDVTTGTTLAASLPTLFVQARYSRDLETEADRFAGDWMTAHEIPPQALGKLLQRLDEGNASAGFLATHPATAERVKMLAAPSP